MVTGRLHNLPATNFQISFLPIRAIERLPMAFQRKEKSAAALQPTSLLKKSPVKLMSL
jgi:hypothetical protein